MALLSALLRSARDLKDIVYEEIQAREEAGETPFTSESPVEETPATEPEKEEVFE